MSQRSQRHHPSSCILHSSSPILHPSHGFLILPPTMNLCPIHYATMQKIPTYHRSAIDPATTAIAEVHLTRKPPRLHKNTSCVKAPSLATSSTDRLLCSLAKCTMSCCFSTQDCKLRSEQLPFHPLLDSLAAKTDSLKAHYIINSFLVLLNKLHWTRYLRPRSGDGFALRSVPSPTHSPQTHMVFPTRDLR